MVRTSNMKWKLALYGGYKDSYHNYEILGPRDLACISGFWVEGLRAEGISSLGIKATAWKPYTPNPKP